ncbi:MAG TPA: hypothetical protein IAC04_06190 [Candidatus Coprenecus stercoravium]|uniref:Lipoprotein n=1 Tax=Candidatus Coprenecus stercoravium TaxID=2840735 RepID=A0A9D2KAK4_9BACT|nr:hypothetical protein [Candidatus Coprenecus stercoravium]
MLKKKYIVALAILSACAVIQSPAQNKRDYYKEFYEQRTSEINKFKDEMARANAEFSDYLRQAWQEFLVKAGRVDPIGPVPDEPVYYEGAPDEHASHGLPSAGRLVVPAVSRTMPAVSAGLLEDGAVAIDFYGLRGYIPFDESMRLPRIMASERGASEGWNVLSGSDYMPTVEAFAAMRERYSLSDWALYTAIKEFTDAVYIQEYVNEKVLTQMFILSQMKYKARVGSAGGELILLLPFSEQIYQMPYISDADEDFYIFSYSRLNSQEPLYTFAEDFSIADQVMNLVIDRQMEVGEENYQPKTLTDWNAILEESAALPLNIPYVRFTLNYPQSDLLTYHKSAVDEALQKAVFTQIRYRILKDGMDKVQAVAFVLGLIQKGFEYKTDYEMFGRSKPLFVEESFYYGSNNCKDRVLIFSWIVKDLLGLDAVMFSYPGHVSCGVALPDDVAGDSYQYEGVRYVMCDPTYIGAPIGATMPKYRDVEPQIVRL